MKRYRYAIFNNTELAKDALNNLLKEAHVVSIYGFDPANNQTIVWYWVDDTLSQRRSNKP